MLSIFASLLAAALVSAQVVPKTPATANVGSQLTIEWDADPTKTWTNTSIDFMSGDNWNMIDIENVATGIDGTTAGSLQWTVPDVTIYSNIYFFQFTKDGDVTTAQWCTRFTIASAAGKTVAAPDSIQPDGQTIGWGSGGLAGATGSAASGSVSASSAPAISAAVQASTIAAASSIASVSSTDSVASASAAPVEVAASNKSTNDSSDASKQVAGLGLALALGLVPLLL